MKRSLNLIKQSFKTKNVYHFVKLIKIFNFIVNHNENVDENYDRFLKKILIVSQACPRVHVRT